MKNILFSLLVLVISSTTVFAQSNNLSASEGFLRECVEGASAKLSDLGLTSKSTVEIVALAPGEDYPLSNKAIVHDSVISRLTQLGYLVMENIDRPGSEYNNDGDNQDNYLDVDYSFIYRIADLRVEYIPSSDLRSYLRKAWVKFTYRIVDQSTGAIFKAGFVDNTIEQEISQSEFEHLRNREIYGEAPEMGAFNSPGLNYKGATKRQNYFGFNFGTILPTDSDVVKYAAPGMESTFQVLSIVDKNMAVMPSFGWGAFNGPSMSLVYFPVRLSLLYIYDGDIAKPYAGGGLSFTHEQWRKEFKDGKVGASGIAVGGFLHAGIRLHIVSIDVRYFMEWIKTSREALDGVSLEGFSILIGLSF